ncbi:21780_t:CDS:2, partial [Cetraspora pellucida]
MNFSNYADGISEVDFALIILARQLNNIVDSYNQMHTDYVLKDCHEKIFENVENKLKINNNDIDSLKIRGTMYTYLNQYEKALNDINKVLEHFPDDFDSLKTRIMIHLNFKKPELALIDLNNLLENNHVNNIILILCREYIFLNSSHHGESSFIDFNGIIGINWMNNAFILKCCGEINQKLGYYEEAFKYFNKSLEINPNDEFILNSREKIYMLLNNLGGSNEDFNNIVTLELYNSSLIKVCNYYELNRHDKSLVDLTKSLKINPNDYKSLVKRGDIYQVYKNVGKYKESLLDFTNALTLEPNNEFALMSIITTNDLLGKSEESLIILNSILKNYEEFKNLLTALTIRGEAYRQMGQYEKSLNDLDRSIEINPYNAHSFEIRGATLYTIGFYGKALQDLDNGLELDSDNYLCYGYRGALYLKLNHYEKSQQDLDKAIELCQDDSFCHWQRGSLYSALGKYNEALYEFISLDNFNPRSELDKFEQAEAFYNRGILNKKLGNYENSASDLSKAIDLGLENEQIKCDYNE